MHANVGGTQYAALRLWPGLPLPPQGSVARLSGCLATCQEDLRAARAQMAALQQQQAAREDELLIKVRACVWGGGAEGGRVLAAAEGSAYALSQPPAAAGSRCACVSVR